MYIYPDNLKSKATLWLWALRDLAIIGIGSLISVFALSQLGFFVPIVLTAAYAFLSIRMDDTSILDFLRYAVRYFLLQQQSYSWGMTKTIQNMCAAHSVTKKRDSPGVSMVQRRFHLSGLSSWPHGGWRISAKSPVWWRSTLTKEFSPPSILWMAGRASGSKMCPPPPTLRTRAAM